MMPSYFNPRAPRGARQESGVTAAPKVNFNPRAPRGARQIPANGPKQDDEISIHVPREGHDHRRRYQDGET